MQPDEVKTQVSEMQNDQFRLRLRNWRSRLRASDTEIFRWLRTQQEPPTRCIFNDAEGPDQPASQDLAEALENLEGYWQQIWSRPRQAEERSAQEYLQEFADPRQSPEVWGPVPFECIRQSIRKQRAKAAGCDGWSGDEITAWPREM